MSKPGNPYDNANKIFANKDEVKKAIFEYIEMFYNRKRRHSSLAYLSPLEFEKLNLQK
ncbi:transposase [Tepidibacter aestuarii]|nr:transposase [Tepidibacter aestuarii]